MAEDEPSARALSLLDLAPCGLLQTSAAGLIHRANKLFCTWTGYSASELVGRRRLQDLLTVGGRIFHHTHWAPLLAMQGSVSEVKLELMHRDGAPIPIVLNAEAHRLPDGTLVHEIAAFVARDRDQYEKELVLSRRKLEAAVSEANRLEAEAKDRALFAEQMVGIVSHDLRNPLSSIAIGAALLARADLPESQRRTLSRISRSTERASRLINDLLDFTQARIGAGLPVNAAPIDLHEVVAHSVDELAHVYPGRALNHQRAGEGQCRADANRLNQVVGNLVSNAMAYGDGQRPVTVRSSVEASCWSIAVHNHGAPIPEEARARIFQPMTRASSTGTARSVGLGLFIVEQIARAHGGSARVASVQDEGTTFTVVIPRA